MSNKFLDKLLVEKTYVVGIFKDDDDLLKAIYDLKEKKIYAKDAFLPFPVHGIDKALDIRRSRIGYAAFSFGLLGAVLAILLQVYTMHWDWPVNIGGKPTLAIPSFIPVTFEVTVLFTALGLSAVYFLRSNLMPGLVPKLFDQRQTTDRFVLIYEVEEAQREDLKKQLEEKNAIEVRTETVKESKFGMPLPFKY
jgi:hypothetical protein